MHARTLLLGLAWLTVVPCRGQEGPAPTPPRTAVQELLDGGLLEPEWFGPGPVWTRDWRVDYFWAKPDVRLDPPSIYFRPWEEPKFLSERDALDYASGWEAAEYLQNLLRTRLAGMAGLRLATSPEQTPYHASGRIVEATHIRQGAGATFGIAAGLPTFTWDFKVTDLRSGEVILASHHRSVWAPASTWVAALEAPLRTMAGLPPTPPWEEPPDAHKLEDGSWHWVAPGLRLAKGSLEAGHWTALTDTGGWWKGWTNGPGTSFAAGAEVSIRDRLARSALARGPEQEPVYIVSGQLFTTPKFLKPRYRALVTEVATGRVVVRHEVRSPMGRINGVWQKVAERVVAHLESLLEGAAIPVDSDPGALAGSSPPEPMKPTVQEAAPPPRLGPTVAVPPAPAWEGLDRLVPVSGAVDKAWVSPVLSLAGRTLQVANWGEPTLKPEADSYDRRLARVISSQAPAWLFGALAAHPKRGFRIHRQEGDLRLEGRVVHLYQPDRSKFWTLMGQAYTLGLSAKAEGILQLRVVDAQTGATLALVEHTLTSFQMASDGVPYKAFKWLAQGMVKWLLQEGRQRLPPASPPAETQGSPAPPREGQGQIASMD